MIKRFLSEIDDLKSRSVPKEEFILLDRANLGIFTKLTSWKSAVDWKQGREDFQRPVHLKALKNITDSDPSFLEMYNKIQELK